jgi:hypothetical protein
MTDTATQGLNVNPDQLRAVLKQIVELDEQLAAASGSDALGKRAYLNNLVETHKGNFEGFMNQVVEHLRTNLSENPEVLAAAVTGLDQAITKAFGEQVNKLASDYVEANKTETPEVSTEQITEWENQRRELTKRYHALRGVLEMFEFDVSDIDEPKKMSGSRGPRGPRVLSNFDYIVNGKPRTKSQNTLSSIAATVFKDTKFSSAKTLREELARQGLDLKNPPDEWEYDIAIGDDKSVKLAAVKTEAKDEYVSSDDDDDDENGEDGDE